MLLPEYQGGVTEGLPSNHHPMKDPGCPPIPYDQPPGHPAVASPPPQQNQLGQQPQQVTHQGHQQNQQHSSQQPQQHLSRQSQTVSAGPSTPPSSTGEARRISCQDIQMVQNLIEQCLQLYMNQQEAVSFLLNKAKIEPGFTGLVWQKLEEQNTDFFKAYYTRLLLKQQITTFNELLKQQAELMPKMCPSNSASPPISNGLHASPMQHASIGYPVQQPAMAAPRIHNMGRTLVPTNQSLINGGSPLPNSVHMSNEKSVSSGRMGIASGMPPVLHGDSGISPGNNEMAIQTASGFSNSSTFPFTAVGNPTDMPSADMDVSVPSFNSNDAQSQSGAGSLQDNEAGCPKELIGFLGQIPRNFSLSDLTADFSHSSDILGSYSGSPFLTPETEAFLHSPEKECLDDERMLDPISETLSYDDFASD
eukprot:Gb_40500 [translate_table: standard]